MYDPSSVVKEIVRVGFIGNSWETHALEEVISKIIPMDTDKGLIAAILGHLSEKNVAPKITGADRG
jgi:hypothetical protein